MPTVKRCSPPLRLALVWGAAAAVLGLLAVVLFFWTGWGTDSGMTCSPPIDDTGLACRLYGTWAAVLHVAAVLAGASVVAVLVAEATERRAAGPEGTDYRNPS